MAAPEPAESDGAGRDRPPRSGWATERPRRQPTTLGGWLATMVQATGELAAIGAAYGAQAVKGAVQRLPRP